MIYDLQKASIWKRISALLFDFILLVCLIMLCSTVLSAVLGYDSQSQVLSDYYDKYETQYGVVFDITYEEYEALDADQKANYDAAYNALAADEGVLSAYSKLMNTTLLIVTFSILAAYLVLEFAVPLLLGNGQTLGKKIFGIGVMRTCGIRISGVSLFIRTVLGKFTIETMIPVLMVIMLYFSSIGITGIIILAVVFLAQIISLIVTRTNSAIHDLLSDTVTVDISSQMIFKDPADRTEYLKKIAAQEAERKTY